MTDAEKAAADKAAADKAAAEAKAKADAEAKAAAGKGSSTDDGGDDLADVFSGGGDDKGKGKAAGKGGVELSLKVPDDLKGEISDDVVNGFLAHAKESGFTQEQLQKWADFEFELARDEKESSRVQREQTRVEWERELMADPQIGGAKMRESLEVAKRGARALGLDPRALVAHVRNEKHIDGPTLIRAFHMAGLAQSEDRLGGTGEGKPKDEDAGLSPSERDFKRMHPETWKRMQAEKTGRA